MKKVFCLLVSLARAEWISWSGAGAAGVQQDGEGTLLIRGSGVLRAKGGKGGAGIGGVWCSATERAGFAAAPRPWGRMQKSPQLRVNGMFSWKLGAVRKVREIPNLDQLMAADTDNRGAAAAFCALYDRGGGLLGVREAPAEGGSLSFRCDTSLPDHAKAFFLDGTFRPVGNAWEAAVEKG